MSHGGPGLELIPGGSDPRPRAVAPADRHALAVAAADVVPWQLHVTYPWADLHAIYGPLLPGDLHIVSARTGSGKTLFVRNWLHAMAAAEHPTHVAYFPTETPAADVLRDLVCAAIGVDPVAVKRDDFSRVDGGRDAFWREVNRWQEFLLAPLSTLTAGRLTLYQHPRPSVAEVWASLEQAAERGVRVAIIDHLLRLNIGDGSSIFAEVTAAIRTLKTMAQELGIAVVVTSQQSRQQGGDRLSWYSPPDLQALKGAGTIEEEADGVLFIHRLLRDDLTDKDKAAVRSGLMPLQDVVAPHLMGCAIGKLRIDGSKVGAACRLWVEHGTVRDLPDRERAAWQAAQHAIRTSRDFK